MGVIEYPQTKGGYMRYRKANQWSLQSVGEIGVRAEKGGISAIQFFYGIERSMGGGAGPAILAHRLISRAV